MYKTWGCIRCLGTFVDTDEHPEFLGKLDGEPQEYWLSPLEPICNRCAQELKLTNLEE